MGAEARGKISPLSKTFSVSFLRAGYPSRVQVKFNESKKPSFYHILWFKGRREMSLYQVVPFRDTLVVDFPRKSTQVKIHPKPGIFWLLFSAKNPVKSNKLALIEDKILN